MSKIMIARLFTFMVLVVPVVLVLAGGGETVFPPGVSWT